MAVVAVVFIQKWTFRTDVEQIGVIRLWRSLRGRPIITISVDAVEVAAPSVASSRQEYGVAVRTGVITSFQTVQCLPLAGAIFNQFVYLLWRWHLPFVSPFFMGNVITHACYVGIAFENLSCYLYGFFLNCNIKSTITIIPIIINLIDAEWPIVLSLRNEHNKPITIQHRAWDTFRMFILILFCESFTSSAKLLLKY